MLDFCWPPFYFNMISLRPHPISYQTPPPPKGWILPYGLRLLGNFQVSQVAPWRCTLLAGNSALHQSCWQWGTDKFFPAISQNASNSFRYLYSCFFVVFKSFSQNFLLGAPVYWKTTSKWFKILRRPSRSLRKMQKKHLCIHFSKAGKLLPGHNHLKTFDEKLIGKLTRLKKGW